MFSQVYFHKVRRIYDYHIVEAIKEILKHNRNGKAEYPSVNELGDYLMYDDWEIYSALKKGIAKEKGEAILNRKHFECKYDSNLIPFAENDDKLKELQKVYKGRTTYLDDKASTEWYKPSEDIFICGDGRIQELSEKSAIVRAMRGSAVHLKRFYVSK